MLSAIRPLRSTGPVGRLAGDRLFFRGCDLPDVDRYVVFGLNEYYHEVLCFPDHFAF